MRASGDLRDQLREGGSALLWHRDEHVAASARTASSTEPIGGSSSGSSSDSCIPPPLSEGSSLMREHHSITARCVFNAESRVARRRARREIGREVLVSGLSAGPG